MLSVPTGRAQPTVPSTLALWRFTVRYHDEIRETRPQEDYPSLRRLLSPLVFLTLQVFCGESSLRTDQSAVVTWPLDAYLVSDGLFGWEVVGPHLRECALQLVVQCPELSVPPVHIPLVVLYPDVDLPTRETGRQAESSQRRVLHHSVHKGATFASHHRAPSTWHKMVVLTAPMDTRTRL